MMSIVRNTAVITSIVAIIVYALYRYKKGIRPISHISYESILTDAIQEIKNANGHREYTLVIFPPQKSKEFIDQNPGYFKNVKLSQIKDNLLVIWFLQNGDQVLGQNAIIGKTLSSDFTDIIPMDKIYRKQISIK